MGFHVEINSILRSDEDYSLERGSEHPFTKTGSRIFFDDLPIWLTGMDWTARAEIRVLSQTRTPSEVHGTFRVLHVVTGEQQSDLTVAFRRMFAGGSDPFIYLTLSPEDHDKAKATGVFDPPSRATDGFIHAAPAKQVNRVANKHFSKFSEVRILVLRSDRIRSEIRWEPTSTGLYPHIYGPVNLDAVEAVIVGQKGADGLFNISLVAPTLATPAAAMELTASEPPALTQALASAAVAAARPYFDAPRDAQDRQTYYAGLAADLSPAARFQALSQLLRETHTRTLGYDPKTHLYPFVDLHPDGRLRSLYSGKPVSVAEFIRDDFRIEQARATRFRAMMAARLTMGATEMADELAALEATMPFNCEHSVPQSWFTKGQPMRGDLHHLFACETKCNSFRSNIPYFDFTGVGNVVRQDCGSKQDIRFEPAHGKGAVARATLYFLMRYPGRIGDRTAELQRAALPMLLDWHAADPVGDWERHRNQAIFAAQGNRNPLIDFQNWATSIDFGLGFGS